VRRQEGRFELELRYDVDGILHVRAWDAATGKSLLADTVDFFQDGISSIDPEIRDIAESVEEMREVVIRQRVRPVAPVHHGPVLVVDASNMACHGRNIKGGEPLSYDHLVQVMTELSNIYKEARLYVVADVNLRHRLSAHDRPRLDEDLAGKRVVLAPAGTVGRSGRRDPADRR
jgi:hypothetical protein